MNSRSTLKIVDTTRTTLFGRVSEDLKQEILDWVQERATENAGTNPGRNANKCREHVATSSTAVQH